MAKPGRDYCASKAYVNPPVPECSIHGAGPTQMSASALVAQQFKDFKVVDLTAGRGCLHVDKLTV